MFSARFQTILSLLLIFSFASPLYAQGPRRLGVIDIDADSLSVEDRQAVLSTLKASLDDQRLFAVVRDQEVESKLIQKSKSKSESEKLKAEHLQKKNEIDRLFEEGQKDFLASHFDEAIRSFDKAVSFIPQASLVISPNMISDLMQFLGTSHYFVGNERQARSYFAALLDLNPEAAMNSQKFPPPVIQLFNSVKSEARFEFKSVKFESSVRGFSASLAGYELQVNDATSSVSLPVAHPVWGNMNVILTKEGFAPAIFAMKELPKEVRWMSIRDRRQVTRGLFSPLGAATPPIELKKLMVNLDLSVVFLGSANKDLEGRWLLKGQWLEGATSRSSPIVQSSAVQLTEAVQSLVKNLLIYVDAEGRVISSRSEVVARHPHEEEIFEEVKSSKPFYKTWWFWSLMGVAAVGTGVGTYYLLSPSESLKVKVVQAN